MKSLAVFTASGARLGGLSDANRILIKDIPIHVGIYDTKKPEFDPKDPKDRNRVLVRIRAFSCNYRDQSLIFAAASRPEPAFYIVGSEFSGEVVAVGADVTGFSDGNRVIANAAYHGLSLTGPVSDAHGVPSNHSSQEYQIFDVAYLEHMPNEMSFVQGAAFTVGAQTAYGMVRRADVRPGTSALITAGRSNTSLFLAQALKARGVRVFAISNSSQHLQSLHNLGIEKVFQPNLLTRKFQDKEPLVAMAQVLGGFDYIFDPFFDIYLSRVIILLVTGGTYVTCGLFNQHQEALGLPMPAVMTDYKEAMSHVMMNNLKIQGNCLGLTDDLKSALTDFRTDRLSVVIDSVFGNGEAGKFLERSYIDPERFGKVVYQYP